MTFESGDKVVLKPNQSTRDGVLLQLSYGTVYTVGFAAMGQYVYLDEDPRKTAWLADRFELASAPAAIPATGDTIEFTIRAVVSAVQETSASAPGTTHVVYLSTMSGGYAPPIYLGPTSAITSLRVVKPPKLDLDALPPGTVVEGECGTAETGALYRKISDTVMCWAGLDGKCYTTAELYRNHTEFVELARKEATV